MNVHFTARQTALTPEVKDYCQKRLERLKKLTSFPLDVDIILSVEKNRSKAEVHIKAKGGGTVVVEETPDMIHSLDRAFDSVEKKLKKEKEKFRERKRRGGRTRKGFTPPVEPEEGEVRVFRSPLYAVKPMTVDEALIQFEAKNKEVLVFRKEGTEAWAVLFRRKDGHVGLVEPE
jgi:putative sigma-54 modulation protein